MLQHPEINGLDREEAEAALDRIKQLSKRELTSDVLGRIKEKVEFVKNVAETVKSVGDAVAPYLAPILTWVQMAASSGM